MATTIMNGVATTTSTDAYGNKYTTSVSKDGLQSRDFIALMLKQLSLQDPTKTIDSSKMLESQLQLSTLRANTATIDSMRQLRQTALSSAASLIGSVIEDNSKNSDGKLKQYKVTSVSKDSDENINLTTHELTGYYDKYTFEEFRSDNTPLGSTSSGDSITFTTSDNQKHTIKIKGKTYKQLAKDLDEIDGIKTSMVKTNKGYNLVVYVSGGRSSVDFKGFNLSYSTSNLATYSNEAKNIKYTDVKKIYD